MNKRYTATLFAILAAALYAINVPLSKALLQHVAPTMMAAFLYLGAGGGLLLYSLLCRAAGRQAIKEPLTRKELPYTIAMVLLDVAAPILLMLGIARTTSASVSLLNNFEIVATSLIALLIFKEVISPRLWVAIGLVTLASMLLGFEGFEGFRFNTGSILVLCACVCWGFENNCTKKLSSKSSIEIVTIKGCFSGLGSLLIALCLGEPFPALKWMGAVLLLGFVAYGLSINFYILAQKELGAAKTSAYYSIAPFLGVAFSMLVLRERPGAQFYLALGVMAVSTFIMMKDTIALQHMHQHAHVHTHAHRHGDIVHSHEHQHVHTHTHVHDGDAQLHQHTHAQLPDHEHPHPSGTVPDPL
ncbi:MAG: DMT family transporter [Clostridia bacterium]|nr:DMT family transporter [Clostridia bacterium]